MSKTTLKEKKFYHPPVLKEIGRIVEKTQTNGASTDLDNTNFFDTGTAS